MQVISLLFPFWALTLFFSAWILPRRFQNMAIAVHGILFISLTDFRTIIILCILTGIVYLAEKKIHITNIKITVTVVSIFLLIYFYKSGLVLGQNVSSAAVPLGLSYFSLRIIHYVIEGIKGTLPNHRFRDFIRYLLFFPTFTAGPINRFNGFFRDSFRRRFDTSMLAQGLERMLYGYTKISVLANFFFNRKMEAYLISHQSLPESIINYLECIKYGGNLYFQFSGYSDIAIGLALTVGFRIEENFNWPFLATNINDFWKRWHITLSEWCKDYIYFPSAAILRNTLIPIVFTMITLALWHELSFRYIVWGAYHGIAIALWQIFQKLKYKIHFLSTIKFLKIPGTLISWILTLNTVLLSFCITGNPSIIEGFSKLVSILTLRGL